MTINEAIKRLDSMKKEYGGDTLVYFDCPKCNFAFEPDKLVATAVHLTEKKK